MSEEAKLTALREKIDKIDRQLVTLLNKRALVAYEIGITKHSRSIYRPERETSVLANVAGLNNGPLPQAAMALIFHIIMATCLDAQLK